MKHRKSLKKFGRTTAHRKALLRNLATSLVLKGRVTTTVVKAKALKRVGDKLVTLGKRGDLNSRRIAMSYLQVINRTVDEAKDKRTAVHNLFEVYAPRFANREGGYTRVVRLGTRLGDSSEMAVVEFVEDKVERRDRRKRRVATTEASIEAQPNQ